MVPKIVLKSVLVLLAFQATTCQIAEEPPLDFGGSGDGPDTVAASSINAPVLNELENIDNELNLDLKAETTPSVAILDEIDETVFPTSVVHDACDVCSCDKSEESFVVDCSHKDITEIPEGIAENTTVLNLQYNKLETLPKSINTLKKLKELKADNNLIKELEFGSLSELSELRILNLSNNKLTEVPQELKNSFGLTNLDHLELTGNQFTEINAEIFSQFKSLRTIKLDNVTVDFIKELCNAVNTSLQEVCQSNTCSHCDLIDDNIPIHPGMIAADINLDSDATTIAPAQPNTTVLTTLAANLTRAVEATTEFSLKSAVDNVQGRKANPAEGEKKEDIKTEGEVKVGATTNEENPGGVSTLLIGLVVAGMVVVVAIVVIRKNWSRISGSRPPTDRPGVPNGTAPEEVPLREKPNPV